MQTHITYLYNYLDELFQIDNILKLQDLSMGQILKNSEIGETSMIAWARRMNLKQDMNRVGRVWNETFGG